MLLLTIKVQLHVKYNLPKLLNSGMDTSECFSFNFHTLESEGSQKETANAFREQKNYQCRRTLIASHQKNDLIMACGTL